MVEVLTEQARDEVQSEWVEGGVHKAGKLKKVIKRFSWNILQEDGKINFDFSLSLIRYSSWMLLSSLTVIIWESFEVIH